MVLLSFVDIQKIWIFTKFGGCSSKIEPATPILILKFKRVWQTQFFSHTLQILVNDRFFIGNQMIFYSIFCISNRKAEIWEKLLFLFLSSPQVVKNTSVCWRHKKLNKISFDGLWKICHWPKFGGCGWKIESATPSWISKSKWA